VQRINSRSSGEPRHLAHGLGMDAAGKLAAQQEVHGCGIGQLLACAPFVRPDECLEAPEGAVAELDGALDKDFARNGDRCVGVDLVSHGDETKRR
jgi:hypothetical protein